MERPPEYYYPPVKEGNKVATKSIRPQPRLETQLVTDVLQLRERAGRLPNALRHAGEGADHPPDTCPGGGQVPGTSSRPRGLRHNDHYPMKDLIGAPCGSPHGRPKDHLRGDPEHHWGPIKGKRDTRLEMVQGAHGAAPRPGKETSTIQTPQAGFQGDDETEQL